MSTRFSFGRPLVAIIVAAGANMAAAQSTTQPSDDTSSQITELRGEVQQLREQINSNPNNSNPQAQSPTIAANTAPPPASQNGLLGLNGGWDPNRGFVIKSEDDSFLLHPWFFAQFRYDVNNRSELIGGGSQTSEGFEVPRAKLILDGNIFTKDITYQIIWATSDTTGNLGLQDAWARYHIPGTPFGIEGGQIRNPLDHEQIMFATKTMTPERSIVNNILINGDDIVKGVELSYGYDGDSMLRGLFAVTSGERNFDTDFEDYPVNPASWGC
jgi:hypothetical protein